MDTPNVTSVDNVTLNRRGYCISGSLVLSRFHLVFNFHTNPDDTNSPLREIWICYPIIDKISKARGSSWINNNKHGGNFDITTSNSPIDKFDHYSASHMKLQCKDFTYYSFDFVNDLICTEVFRNLSSLITVAKSKNSIHEFYAFDYKPNLMESSLSIKGWQIYDPIKEYQRQELIGGDGMNEEFWRLTQINKEYRFCSSYPDSLIVPASVSDNVLKHAGKFRSKQRIPAVVYKHRSGVNGNVIARCSQPLVGLNLQNRSIQDEKLIAEIFESQKRERLGKLNDDDSFNLSQSQKNLIVDLRPITNAMAQHALGAGTENIDNYRGKAPSDDKRSETKAGSDLIEQRSSHTPENKGYYQVDKIFGNIDNIHVIRESLNKLVNVLSELDKFPISTSTNRTPIPLLQQSLNKTQWLHRLSIILQSVDRITKSIHLNNTNVIIHCSDGWDRTSQVSALSQLCLDPYYRTIEGFMVLIEKEWVSFGFKFATRGDHGGCVGALMQKPQTESYASKFAQSFENATIDESQQLTNGSSNNTNNNNSGVSSFLQKAARAANHIKTTARAAASSSGAGSEGDGDGKGSALSGSSYGGSNEKSPVFHQFLDCVYQIYRQHPSEFEFNSRFLKRLFYHYYSCQYGSFLCDSERELKEVHKLHESCVSVWDYFRSRTAEFKNSLYSPPAAQSGSTSSSQASPVPESGLTTESSSSSLPSASALSSYEKNVNDSSVLFFNFTDVKWWYELYGRSDEEMNGLSNSLDRKFAQLKLHQPTSNTSQSASPSPSAA